MAAPSLYPSISPTKHAHNPHPYAVKTSSTGILTRSNSSPNAKSTRHYYVPLSPSPSPSGSESEGGDEWRGKGHRYTASWEALQALPQADEPPKNPKLWATSHLVTYIKRHLGDDQFAVDWVKDRGLNGKAFLRLDEAETPGMPRQLIALVRDLRVVCLKDRISVDSTSPFTSEILQKQHKQADNAAASGSRSSRIRSMIESWESASENEGDEHSSKMNGSYIQPRKRSSMPPSTIYTEGLPTTHPEDDPDMAALIESYGLHRKISDSDLADDDKGGDTIKKSKASPTGSVRRAGSVRVKARNFNPESTTVKFALAPKYMPKRPSTDNAADEMEDVVDHDDEDSREGTPKGLQLTPSKKQKEKWQRSIRGMTPDGTVVSPNGTSSTRKIKRRIGTAASLFEPTREGSHEDLSKSIETLVEQPTHKDDIFSGPSNSANAERIAELELALALAESKVEALTSELQTAEYNYKEARELQQSQSGELAGAKMMHFEVQQQLSARSDRIKKLELAFTTCETQAHFSKQNTEDMLAEFRRRLEEVENNISQMETQEQYWKDNLLRERKERDEQEVKLNDEITTLSQNCENSQERERQKDAELAQLVQERDVSQKRATELSSDAVKLTQQHEADQQEKATILEQLEMLRKSKAEADVQALTLKSNNAHKEERMGWEPAHMRALPSFVILAAIGVATVVFRVVGRRAFSGILARAIGKVQD